MTSSADHAATEPMFTLAEMQLVREEGRRLADRVTELERKAEVGTVWLDRAHRAEARATELERERDEDRALLKDCQRGRRAAQDEAFARLDRAERAETALRELDDWVSRMPDAGFNQDDPRWDWWHQRPRISRAALGETAPIISDAMRQSTKPPDVKL